MKISIIVLLISLSYSQFKYLHETSYVWEADMLLVTYIYPQLDPKYKDCYFLLNIKEYTVLSKIEDLLEGIKSGNHPEWRARQIVQMVEKYVAHSKEYENKLVEISKDIDRLKRF
tara:strand:- start:5747 stop:6091 length:345 start_codon:yes stop_codon:yes gene_type:complete